MSKAQLLRDAKNGMELLQTFYEYGDVRFPFWRKVKKIQTNAFALETPNKSGESWIYLDYASLVDYNGKTLTIYNPGYRKPTLEEQRILMEWDKITKTEDYQKALERDCLTDGSSCYWRKRAFFEKNNAIYLCGWEEQRGMKMCVNSDHLGEILDQKVRGTVSLKYDVRLITK